MDQNEQEECFEDNVTALGRSLITAAQRGDTATVRAIVRLHGARGLENAIKARTPDGQYTALAEAVLGGHCDLAEELLAAGALSSTEESGLDLQNTANLLGYNDIVALFETIASSSFDQPEMPNQYQSRFHH